MGLPPRQKPVHSHSQVRSVDVYSAKIARINSQLRRQPTEMASDASTRVSSRGNQGGDYTPKINLDYKAKLNMLPEISGHKKQYSIAGEQLDPPFNHHGYTPMSARGNRNRTSDAMSRALGFESNRYGGPQQAIKQARELSNDHRRQYKPITPRGPCP